MVTPICVACVGDVDVMSKTDVTDPLLVSRPTSESSLEGAIFQLESLILAQNERWRRA